MAHAVDLHGDGYQEVARRFSQLNKWMWMKILCSCLKSIGANLVFVFFVVVVALSLWKVTDIEHSIFTFTFGLCLFFFFFCLEWLSAKLGRVKIPYYTRNTAS